MQAISPDIFNTPLALRVTKIEIEPNLVRYFQNKFEQSEQWSVIHLGTLTEWWFTKIRLVEISCNNNNNNNDFILTILK